MALLTEAKARNIKPTDKPIPHGGVAGLRLMPSKTKGRGKWVLRFVSPVTGKRRDAGLGSYPVVGIAEAREKAEAMQLQISKHIDPIEDAKAALVLTLPIRHTFIADVLGKSLERKPTHQPMMRFDAIPGFVSEFLIAGTSTTQNLILFTILTAVRSANARAASWAEFDLANGIWSIPSEKMKVDKPLRLPLSTGVLAILERQRGLHPVLVFPSPRELILSDMAMTSFLRKHNAPSDVEGRTATAHGFRSSFKIWAVEAGHLDELSEIALGHSVGNKVSRAYRRTDQLDQRRPMMHAWSDFVVGPPRGRSMADSIKQYLKNGP